MTLGACSRREECNGGMMQTRIGWRQGSSLMVGYGMSTLTIYCLIISPAERDRHVRRNKDDGHATVKVDSFRGVNFASWRRIFMQVSPCIWLDIARRLPGFLVFFHSYQARRLRPG
jgi:hypothetical protein